MATKLQEHIELIKEELLGKRKTVVDVMETLKSLHNIEVSKATFEKFLATSKIQKNKKGDDWVWADCNIRKRKAEGKDSELIVNGVTIPEEKRKKEIARHVSTFRQQTFRMVQDPTTPEGWSIRTPHIPEDIDMAAEERSPSPPAFPPPRLFDKPDTVGENPLSDLSDLSAVLETDIKDNSASFGQITTTKQPNIAVSGESSAGSSGAHHLNENEPYDSELYGTPRFIPNATPSDGDRKMVQLDSKSVTELMHNCRTFIFYWECVDANMFQRSIEERYEDISTLVTTSLPWDPTHMEYGDILSFDIEAFGCIEVLHAVYNNDVTRFCSAVAEINLEMCKDTLYAALFIASRQGNAVIVDFLVSSGICSPEWQASDGTTCLHQAATYNQPTVVAVLIQQMGDLNIKCRNGETAFFAICGSLDHEEVSTLLVNAGAELDTLNTRGIGALCVASAANDQDAVRTMLSRGMTRDAPTLCDWCPFHRENKDIAMQFA